MEVLSTIITCLGGLGSLCAIIFGAAAYKRSNKADDGNAGQQLGVILTTLGAIQSDVKEIKQEQNRLREQYTEMQIELSVLKSDMQHIAERVEQAHERISAIKHDADHTV